VELNLFGPYRLTVALHHALKASTAPGGAAVVNLGAATTSLAVYEEGELLHTAVLPFGSEHITADVAIQINGARGYSQDTVLEWIYRYARQARLVDGADEVHQMVLNRFLNDEGRDFWRWEVAP
jgi:alkylation response protein AidB-like acyl-CoA dehydrogenase